METLLNNTRFIVWQSRNTKYSMEIVNYNLHPDTRSTNMSSNCEEFYFRAQRLSPVSSICAASPNHNNSCIWDSGVALITRQSWGYWKLVGSIGFQRPWPRLCCSSQVPQHPHLSTLDR
ncbi:unnamed protein product [Leptidea sinapis]|uniref:Uncharacterized protein n=1 Tax=Leptidea sinapis TaxID=189913 RepID=A0A5E4QC52_9NEOP|nr:unnamed protein product [Leptidea sinapis]